MTAVVMLNRTSAQRYFPKEFHFSQLGEHQIVDTFNIEDMKGLRS